MNKLKLVAVVLAFIQSSFAYATGPMDGIYNCVAAGVNIPNPPSTFMVINSNIGTTAISFPNSSNSIFTGYIVGAAASDTLFIGTTDKSYNIRLSATGFQGAKNLNITGSLSLKDSSISGSLACKQII